MLASLKSQHLILEEIGVARLCSTSEGLGIPHSTPCWSVVQPTWIEVAKILTYVARLVEVVAFDKGSYCMHTSVLPMLVKIDPWYANCSMMGGIYTCGQYLRPVQTSIWIKAERLTVEVH